jgi:hypothetical protein
MAKRRVHGLPVRSQRAARQARQALRGAHGGGHLGIGGYVRRLRVHGPRHDDLRASEGAVAVAPQPRAVGRAGGGAGGGGACGEEQASRAGHAASHRRHGGAVQVESSVDPWLESAWFQPLNLTCDILVSILCYQIQLVPLHHSDATRRLGRRGGRGGDVGGGLGERLLSLGQTVGAGGWRRRRLGGTATRVEQKMNWVEERKRESPPVAGRSLLASIRAPPRARVQQNHTVAQNAPVI